MISEAWLEKQVRAFSPGQLRSILGRERLKWSQQALVFHLLAFANQHREHRHFKAIYQQTSSNTTYQAFMHALGVLAPLWQVLEAKFRQDNGIEFDQVTVVDSSLLPSKEPHGIRDKDWKKGRVTVRKRQAESDKTPVTERICGEKWLLSINSRKQMVFSGLLPSINTSDASVFKQPYTWVRRGLRHGFLVVDRGFSHRAMRTRIAGLRNSQKNYTLTVVSPPHAKQSWKLTPAEEEIYAQRWSIEEVFRQVKDPFGAYRLTMKGIRRARLRVARIALVSLAWNMAHV